MNDDRILTLHPEAGKKGVNIDRSKYDQVKRAILQTLEKNDVMTFTRLLETVEQELAGHFEGSVGWYVETVKLDLEARGVLRREGKSPQMVRLIKGGSDED